MNCLASLLLASMSCCCILGLPEDQTAYLDNIFF
jgi:hypothetical protein